MKEHAVDLAGAARLADKILATCERLVDLPEIGTPRNELRRGLRSVVVNPYTIFYRIARDRVEIVRILHQRQNVRREFGKER